MDLRQIKSTNLDKLTKRVSDNLWDGQFNFGGSIQRFISINNNASGENTTVQQMGAILNGFFAFWVH